MSNAGMYALYAVVLLVAVDAAEIALILELLQQSGTGCNLSTRATAWEP